MFWFTDTDGPTNPQWVGDGAYKRQFTALVFPNNSKCRHTRKPQISKRGVGGGFWPGKATPFPAFLPNVINIWTELYCCSLITRNVATNSHSMGREHFPFVAQHELRYSQERWFQLIWTEKLLSIALTSPAGFFLSESKSYISTCTLQRDLPITTDVKEKKKEM